MLLMETLLTIGQKIALDSARADNSGDLSAPTNNIEGVTKRGQVRIKSEELNCNCCWSDN